MPVSIENFAQKAYLERVCEIRTRATRLLSAILLLEWVSLLIAAKFPSASGVQMGTTLLWIPALGMGVASVVLGYFKPTHLASRLSISASLILFSLILNHVMMSGMATEYHLFGSLAMIGFYMDWKILGWGLFLSYLMHVVPGGYPAYFMQTSFKIKDWIGMEHLGWLGFQGVFLIFGCFYFDNQLVKLARLSAGWIPHLQLQEGKPSSKIIENAPNKVIETSKLAHVGLIASGVFQEVISPLSIIFAHAKKIERLQKLETHRPTEVLQSVQKILSHSSRIQSILESLQSISTQSHATSVEPVTVETLVEETLELIREKLSNHDIELKLTIPHPDLLLEVKPIEIEQVLLNLLQNSFDAVGGTQSAWIELSILRVGEGVLFEVIDSGKGIDPGIATQMMHPFVTTKGVGEGVGLGLTLSENIVRNHGGELKYVLKNGHTCLSFILPLAQTKSLAA